MINHSSSLSSRALISASSLMMASSFLPVFSSSLIAVLNSRLTIAFTDSALLELEYTQSRISSSGLIVMDFFAWRSFIKRIVHQIASTDNEAYCFHSDYCV